MDLSAFGTMTIGDTYSPLSDLDMMPMPSNLFSSILADSFHA